MINISELTHDLREKAEKNRESYNINSNIDDLHNAFSWNSTPEGHEFWATIYTNPKLYTIKNNKPTIINNYLIF